MIGFAESVLAWFGSTFVSVFLGLLICVILGRRVAKRYLAAFALGIFLWFFVDTMGGSANLDVNAGFAGGLVQVAIMSLFAFGVLCFFLLDGSAFSTGLVQNRVGIPLLVAVAVGIHGIGEGTAFAATAASTTSNSLLASFGGLAAGVAYALHKLLEPMMVGACYAAYSDDSNDALRRLRDIILLALVFIAPSMLGALAGYYFVYDAAYFYALGGGTSLYAAVRLSGLIFSGQGAGRSESARVALSLLLGVICIYLAAILHS
jgi:hypothetical protein